MIPAAILVSRRADRRTVARVVTAAVAAATVILGGFAALGFSWIDGLRATMHEYAILDLDRPYSAFLLINLAAWALALGPATFCGLAELRDRRLWALVGGAIASVAFGRAQRPVLG